jgi:hypothetical protein
MFVDKMPDCHSPKHVQILRASANRPVKGLIAGEIVRVMTHWYKGRTLPCVNNSQTECPLCLKSLSVRYYAYVPMRGKLGTAAAVELTATAEAQLVDYLRQQPEGTIPILTVTRAQGKRNNPLSVDVDFKCVSPVEFGNFFSKHLDKDLLKRALCRLWNTPEWDPGVNEFEYYQTVSNYLKLVVEGAV